MSGEDVFPCTALFECETTANPKCGRNVVWTTHQSKLEMRRRCDLFGRAAIIKPLGSRRGSEVPGSASEHGRPAEEATEAATRGRPSARDPPRLRWRLAARLGGAGGRT